MRNFAIAILGVAYLWTNIADAFEIEPVFVAGAEYQLDKYTDFWLHKGCRSYPIPNPEFEVCMGRNPGAEFRLGAEFAFGDWRSKWYVPVFQAGWKHRSHFRDGRPFNKLAETHSEGLFLELRLGGLR